MAFEFPEATPAAAASGDLVERTAGDMLVVYDFECGANGPTIKLLRWVTSGSWEVGNSSPDAGPERVR